MKTKFQFEELGTHYKETIQNDDGGYEKDMKE